MLRLFIAALISLSFAATAQAARKGSKSQPVDTSSSDYCPPVYGGCNDNPRDDGNDQSSDGVTNRHGTFEGNDRGSGSYDDSYNQGF